MRRPRTGTASRLRTIPARDVRSSSPRPSWSRGRWESNRHRRRDQFRRARIAVPVLVVRHAFVAFLLVGALLVALPAAGAAGPGFTGPTTMPGSGGGNEPFVALSAGGVRYVTWQSPGTFASSPDGVHFTNLGSPDPNALGDTADEVDAAGALYNSQICGLPTALHTCVYRSLDGGKTWPQ